MKLISSILLISILIQVEAVADESLKIVSALKGRTYFAPKESISTRKSSIASSSSSSSVAAPVLAPKKSVKIRKPLRYIESEGEGEESDYSSFSDSQSESDYSCASESESDAASSECESDVSSQSESFVEDDCTESIESSSSSVSSTAYSDDSITSCSSSNSIAEGPVCRLSRHITPSPLNCVDYQRPWCPGQVMASLTTRALDPIYDWTNPLTCAQFASNFGGVSVIVGELDGPVFCQAGTNVVTSAYTIVRSLSINQPIYARVLNDSVEFAVAAGPIFYPQGLVYYISVSKEVSKLPQICN
jgi:hypothetical protein